MMLYMGSKCSRFPAAPAALRMKRVKKQVQKIGRMKQALPLNLSHPRDHHIHILQPQQLPPHRYSPHVRVVELTQAPPIFLQADASNFSSLVQKFTAGHGVIHHRHSHGHSTYTSSVAAALVDSPASSSDSPPAPGCFMINHNCTATDADVDTVFSKIQAQISAMRSPQSDLDAPNPPRLNHNACRRSENSREYSPSVRCAGENSGECGEYSGRHSSPYTGTNFGIPAAIRSVKSSKSAEHDGNPTFDQIQTTAAANNTMHMAAPTITLLPHNHEKGHHDAASTSDFGTSEAATPNRSAEVASYYGYGAEDDHAYELLSHAMASAVMQQQDELEQLQLELMMMDVLSFPFSSSSYNAYYGTFS